MKREEQSCHRKIAVLTPVFNRAYVLEKLYRSLVSQKSKNFDWYLVNDGSTDSTDDLVQQWLACDNGFAIHYYRKENGGKHRALNFVIPEIENDYTIIVDSDDYLLDDATVWIESWIKDIDDNKRIAGCSGLRGFSEKDRIGEFPDTDEPYIDAKNTDRAGKHLLGDKAEVYRTAILKKYPFPEIQGEKYIAESVVWNRIALDGYYIRWFNRIIYITEYLADGLTRNLEDNRLNNWGGYSLDTSIIMETRALSRYRYLGRYIKLAKKKKMKSTDICETLKICRSEYCAGCLTCALQSFYDRLKRKKDE